MRVALIEIRGITKSFGDDAVLQGIDLDVHRGERLTIIGKSGCGKSILLKILIGLHPPDAGSIVLEGRGELVGLREREWIPVRARIGMLFQEGGLFDSVSVGDNVAYGLREQRKLSEPEIRERVADSLAKVSLPGIEGMWPADLSGGMRKRVSLARVIAMRPEILLYDEPTEGLDPINVTRVNRVLEGLRKDEGITTVVVTHNMQSAFHVGDRVAFIDEGKVALAGTPAELRALGDPRLVPFLRASEIVAKHA
ncbi:MAG: ATP-binding cassette domain-containing protein [Sandaracinaceae bacterium]|nr:ATP-binding cassette domain-containing protein [Sandaracinaceae bacterium]